MAMNDELVGFVKESLGRGIPRTDVETVLARAGWDRAQVASTMNGFADVQFPVLVPRPRPNLDPRDAFLYLVLFGTLFVTAVNLGTLAFQLIDRAFPDPSGLAHNAQFSASAMRWAISALVVATPVFLLVSRITRAEIRRDPAKRSSRVRRWLTYATMAIASAVLISDLTVLVNGVLSGGLVTSFVLKTIVVGLIAGTILGGYLADLRRDEGRIS